MVSLKATLAAGVLGLSSIGLGVAAPIANAQDTGTIPVDVWSLRSVINTVQVSPDGKHVLVHKVESKEGDYLLEIYSTDDMTKPLRRLNADPMEIINVQWVGDNHIYGTAWKVVRKSVKGPEEDIRSYKGFSYNLKKNKFSEIDGNFELISTLPKEPNYILIGEGNAIPDPTGVDPFELFRPRAYYKLNLDSGSQSLVIKGSEKFPRIQFDADGNPRFTSSNTPGSDFVQEYYRLPGENGWSTFRDPVNLDDHENLYRVLSGIHGIVGYKESDPKIGYLIDNPDGADKAALWEVDFTTGQRVNKLFQAEEADVTGVQWHSIPGNNKLVAAIYPGAKPTRHWFDEEEKALHEALEAQIPNSYWVSIQSRSRDGNTMVVRNIGPHDPGSYWLVRNGKMAKLGSRNPLLDPNKLADVKYIRYEARDGLTIPGWVTIPKGEGPFPLIVQHNGGPHVNGMVVFDEIGQFLASNGYMVFHPDQRISTGWGQKHFDAGYGEHGLAMQDDKDDGVQYLIDQGMADPDRVAFFGWSYGGQAALYTLSRDPQLYQCSVAVAAVADAEKQYKGRRNPDSPKALDDWSQRRGMIGVNPIDEVSKVNIPLLMIHPDDDRRVMYYHFEDYKKAFEAAGKTGQFMTIEGADHFSNTHMYRHQQQLYTKVLDFLKNDCGPGGL